MNELRQAHKTIVRVGRHMVVAAFGYAILALVMQITDQVSPQSSVAPLRSFFVFLSISFAAVILILRGRMFRANATDLGVVGEKAPSQEELIKKLWRYSIVTPALAQSMAVLGLVLYLISGDGMDLILLIGLSLVCFFLVFPRYSQWEEWINRQQKGF